MKKTTIMSIILTAALVLSVSGCKGNEDSDEANNDSETGIVAEQPEGENADGDGAETDFGGLMGAGQGMEADTVLIEDEITEDDRDAFVELLAAFIEENSNYPVEATEDYVGLNADGYADDIQSVSQEDAEAFLKENGFELQDEIDKIWIRNDISVFFRMQRKIPRFNIFKLSDHNGFPPQYYVDVGVTRYCNESGGSSIKPAIYPENPMWLLNIFPKNSHKWYIYRLGYAYCFVEERNYIGDTPVGFTVDLDAVNDFETAEKEYNRIETLLQDYPEFNWAMTDYQD